MERSSGILMHITSLPSKYGIGTLGEAAYDFVDFLVEAGQKYWQILPLTQTGYGDSPYQSCSAFSGNPFLIDLDLLEEEGLLEKEDYEDVDFGDNELEVDYGKIFEEKLPILRIAYENSKGDYDEEIEAFIEEQSHWIEDYGLYMAIKVSLGNIGLMDWDERIRKKDPDIIAHYKEELQDEIDYWIFVQYIFFKQWHNLKSYANEKGIEIIGDIPIYVAEDSVDVWSNPDMFLLEDNLIPKVVAGCPPDAFSETGQLWGNPIYDWEKHKADGYSWWIKRFKSSLNLYDVIRIDHFRGFEAYWQIPYGEETAINGEWIKGPNIEFFEAVEEELGEMNIIAEDLGFMTDELEEFREATGYPGMKLLQFAFDLEEESPYLPYNYYDTNCVAYTGTHDNDTVMGWLEESGDEDEVEFCKDYFKLNEEEGYNWGFIRGAWSSTADVAIALIQDFLGYGSTSRMNTPSTLGWWKWRIQEGVLDEELAEKILHMTKLYGRYCECEN